MDPKFMTFAALLRTYEDLQAKKSEFGVALAKMGHTGLNDHRSEDGLNRTLQEAGKDKRAPVMMLLREFIEVSKRLENFRLTCWVPLNHPSNADATSLVNATSDNDRHRCNTGEG